MRRALAVALLVASLFVAGSPLAIDAAPGGSITWVVDHNAKTITVSVQLEIYSGCSGNPYGTAAERRGACTSVRSQVTQFLADKIKAQIEQVWNAGYMYKCYRLTVNVDIKLAPDAAHIDPDRIAVRIDPSAVGIRDYVSANNNHNWSSGDPADRIDPSNGGDFPTTWSEATGKDDATWAHEFGHVIGLGDSYHDVTDPNTGQVSSVPDQGAPVDLMATGEAGIAQSTINVLVHRNLPLMHDTSGKSVSDSDFKCDLELTISKAQLEQTLPAFSYTLNIKPLPDAPIHLTVDGQNAINGSVPVTLDGPVTSFICTGNYHDQETLIITGTVTADRDGDRTAHLKLSGPPGGGTSVVKCPKLGRSLPIPGKGGFTNRWAQSLGQIDILVNGAALPFSSNDPIGGIPTSASGNFAVADAKN